MMKFIIGLAILSFLYSCDKEETRYLYNKNDPEYTQLLEAARLECVNDSDFFDRFDTYQEFDSAPYVAGDLYKITQDNNDSIKLYVKVEAVNSSDVKLIFNGDGDTYDKIVTWEESDHQSLGEFLKTAVCSKTYAEYFSGISDGTTNLSYKWYKETILQADSSDDSDTNPEAYKRSWFSANVNLNYPTLLYFYNGTKEYKYVFEDGNDEQTKTSKLTIEKIDFTHEDCDNDDVSDVAACDFSTSTTTSFPTCNITVDEDAYKLRAYNSKVISITGTGCNLLPSGFQWN